jgi:hypothetical protein
MASHFTAANGAGTKSESTASGNGTESEIPTATPEPSGSSTAKPD